MQESKKVSEPFWKRYGKRLMPGDPFIFMLDQNGDLFYDFKVPDEKTFKEWFYAPENKVLPFPLLLESLLQNNHPIDFFLPTLKKLDKKLQTFLPLSPEQEARISQDLDDIKGIGRSDDSILVFVKPHNKQRFEIWELPNDDLVVDPEPMILLLAFVKTLYQKMEPFLIEAQTKRVSSKSRKKTRKRRKTEVELLKGSEETGSEVDFPSFLYDKTQFKGFETVPNSRKRDFLKKLLNSLKEEKLSKIKPEDQKWLEILHQNNINLVSENLKRLTFPDEKTSPDPQKFQYNILSWRTDKPLIQNTLKKLNKTWHWYCARYLRPKDFDKFGSTQSQYYCPRDYELLLNFVKQRRSEYGVDPLYKSYVKQEWKTGEGYMAIATYPKDQTHVIVGFALLTIKDKSLIIHTFCIDPSTASLKLDDMKDNLSLDFYKYIENFAIEQGVWRMENTSISTAEPFWYSLGFRYSACMLPDEFPDEPFCSPNATFTNDREVYMYKCISFPSFD